MDGCVQSITAAAALAQIELANLPAEEQMQGMALPEELTNPETFFQSLSNSKGFLMTEGKYYGFRQEEAPSFSQKLQSTIQETHQPKEKKSFDVKESVKEHKFTEEKVRAKELTTQKTESSESHLDKPQSRKQETLEKTQECAEKQLSNSKEVQKPILLQSQPKILFNGGSRELLLERREKKEEPEEARSKQNPAKTREREEPTLKEAARQPENLKQEKEKEKEWEKEREGFAEDQKRNRDDEEKKDQKESLTATGVSFEKQFIDYANRDSIIGEILQMRTSQFDVLLLFLEIMKLAIKSREQERIARQQERELQLMHLQKVCDNFKKQGKYQLFAGIGSGVFAIISGLCPIVGHLKGDWIKDKLSMLMNKMKDIETDKLFKSLTKMTFAMSEMQKSTGQIQNTMAESSRTFDQHMTELYKTDADERTRTMEDIKDHWKNIENFVYQTLQMYHEAIRQLYN